MRAITRFESSLGTMSANSGAEQKETAVVLEMIGDWKRIERGVKVEARMEV